MTRTTIDGLTETIAGLLRLARKRNRSRAQAALARMSIAERGRSTPDDLYAALAREFAELVGAQCGVVIRASAARGRVLGVWAQWPLQDVMQQGDVISAEGACAAAAVLRTGRPAIVDDERLVDTEQSRRLAQAGLVRSLAAPLVHRGRYWGIACVAGTESTTFDDEARATLVEFASLVSPVRPSSTT